MSRKTDITEEQPIITKEMVRNVWNSTPYLRCYSHGELADALNKEIKRHEQENRHQDRFN